MKMKRMFFLWLVLCGVALLPVQADDFFKAVEKGDLDSVSLLLKNNPKLIRQQTGDDETALHLAVQKGNLDMVKLLVSEGFEVNSGNVTGETPLHYASFYGNDKIADFLITRHAGVDARNIEAYTPLHYSLFRGHLNIVKLLLAKGADINAATHYGYTPLDFAQRGKNQELIAFLIAKGGKNIPIGDPEVAGISGNIHRIRFPFGRDSNIAVSAGKDGFLLVDTGFSKRAVPKLKRALQTLGNGKIKYIINTHLHWDHISGNGIADEDTVVIQYKQLDQIQARGTIQAGKTPLGSGDEGLKLYYEMTFNGEKIQLIPYPGIHTEDDMMVYFVKSGVVHTGDLLIPESFPSVRKEVDRYLDFLAMLTDIFPKDTVFISGHGHECRMDDVKRYRGMLVRAAEIIRRSMAEGKSRKEIRDSGVLKEFDSYGTFIPQLNVNYWMGAIFRNSAEKK